MTPYERSRRSDRRMCLLIAAIAVLVFLAAVALPVVARGLGIVASGAVAGLAASAFRV